MKILNLLYKYRYEIKLNRTELFSFVNSGRKEIEEEGFEYKVKNPWDLFAYEVILRGIRAKKLIDKCYNKFLADNYDLFDRLNYTQKQKIFLHELNKTTQALIKFKDSKSGEDIYIPYLEAFINKYYFNDYILVTLKQHLIYIKKFPKEIDIFIKLYGMQPYISDFSSLQLVGQDDEYDYLYHDDFKRIYQFNNNEIINEICLIDRNNKEYPSIELVKEVMAKIIKNEEEKEILEYLYEHKFISNKTYKKIMKKLK